MSNQPTIEQWRRLYDLADRIKALKPWEFIEEDDLFGVRDPDTGVDGFVSVMGQEGEHLAIAVYIGAEALYQFWAMRDDDLDIGPEMLLAIRQLQLSFEDRGTLEVAERKIIKEIGRKYRGKQAWPIFRSFLPGYLPWLIEADEANTLIHALEQTLDVVARAAKDSTLLLPPQDEEETFLIRVSEVQDGVITWADRLVEVLPPDPTAISVPIQLDTLEQAGKLPRRKKSTIELEILTLPQPIISDTGRPYLPTALLMVDGKSGMFLANELLPPMQGLIETLTQIPQIVVNYLLSWEFIPGTVLVRHPMSEEVLSPLQAALGWKVKVQEELKMMDSAVEFLLSAMGLDGLMDAFEEDEDDIEDIGGVIDGLLRSIVDDEMGKEPVRHRGPAAGKSKNTAKSKSAPPSQVYQLKITLKGAKPPIWRRVLVPDNLTLNQLHHVIQIAMGWYDSHLHEFNINNISYGAPDFEFMDDMADDRKVRLSQVIGKSTRRFRYVYDFGDDWEHVIEIENVLPYEPERTYPVCLAGKRACPPEDVGGIWGYEAFLETIKDPSDPEYEEMLEWVGEDFDPEEFDINEVNDVFASMHKR